MRYDDSAAVEAICKDVKSMLVNHKDINSELTLMVNFNAFADSSLDFFVYCFTHTTDWATYHKIKQDVLLRILAIIEQHNAEVAFPTSVVNLADIAEPEGAEAPVEVEVEVEVEGEGKNA